MQNQLSNLHLHNCVQLAKPSWQSDTAFRITASICKELLCTDHIQKMIKHCLRKQCCTPKGSQLSICNMDLQWNRMQEIVTLLCKNKSILTWVLKKLVCMPELLSVSRDIPWWHCFIWSPFLEASQSKMPKHIWGWFAELGMIMISLDRFP